MSMKKLLSSLKKKDTGDRAAVHDDDDTASYTSNVSRTSRNSRLSKRSSGSINSEENDLINELPVFSGSFLGNVGVQVGSAAPQQASAAPPTVVSTTPPQPQHHNTTTPSISTSYTDSLFSRGRRTLSTKNSSFLDPATSRGFSDIGKPLRVLHAYADVATAGASAVSGSANHVLVTRQTLDDALNELLNNLSFIIDQTSKSVLNLSKASIRLVDLFKDFPVTNDNPELVVTSNTSGDLRKIIKIFLHFSDNLLAAPVYSHSRALICKNFNDFVRKLNVARPHDETEVDLHHVPYNTVLQPSVFAVGAIDKLPNEDKLSLIIERICQYDDSRLSEQDGSFIAPVLRGITEKFAILTIVFGFPQPNSTHYEFLKILYNLYPDIHFMIQKNYIKNAAGAAATPAGATATTSATSTTTTTRQIQGFKPPFRIPNNPHEPPMSLSLATENSINLSGTLGGYIYPKIAANDVHLKNYANSVFAVTCGHVVLNESSSTNTSSNELAKNPYPHIAVPSPVLVNLYKKALIHECNKFPEKSEEKIAYSHVIGQIDTVFPVDSLYKKNLPLHRFGQIVWGERTITANNKVSDLAIVKLNKSMKASNFLGDDVPFSEYDPALMFKNLYVRGAVKNDGDLRPGLPVFKYGSTSKYTNGRFNGPKMVYWADGKIQTSEFVVTSGGAANMFAAGGDSGAWILTKLEDLYQNSNSQGLGVVGMLHSYDGEFKQFGLFTCISDVLDRLEAVTSTKWGIVGVDDKDNEELEATSSEGEDSDEDSDYESSDDMDGAIPPEID